MDSKKADEAGTQRPSTVDRADASTPSFSSKDGPSNESIEESGHRSVNGVESTGVRPIAAQQKVAPRDSPESQRSTLQTVIIMLSLCSSVFLAALDTTIVTTALPVISEHFQSNAGYTWIGSAYLLANAASTPSWGKFSDIWGRKPILLLAAAIFFIGSTLCATSVSIGMLIAARAVQGVGGGGLIILVNISISDLFSMRNRGKFFGMVGMVWALASAVGPILGGVFSSLVSWRWCFYINLPITGVVFILLTIFLHLDNPKTPVWDGLKAMDWAGSLAIIGGTLMLLLGLEFGGITHPWGSATVICLIFFGIITAGLFILNEWKFARYPVMPLRLFNHHSNIAALGTCFCHGFVFIAGTYYLPLYFQAVLGATPLLSGVYLLPLALSLSFVSAASGIFIKKTGKYLPPIWFGMFLMTLGFGLFIDFGREAHWAKIIIFQIIAGVGVGPNFQAPLIALQNFVAPRDIGVATSTFGFIRNLSTSISVVIGGVVFQNEMEKKYPRLLATLGPQTAGALSGGSAGASVGLVDQLPANQKIVARQAYSESLQTMFIMYVTFSGLGLFISLFISHKNLNKEHQVTKTGLVEEEAKRKELQEKKKESREKISEEKRASNEVLRAQARKENGEVAPGKAEV
ncbi:MFS multidrug transporter-like protein [Amylocarpus encephaloides]|uniref:Efflux pump dotC n=1 Tax=Amylocarpus encephaloides TaxID=45428 RepID=A0A9P8C690_9HELO|nr:MFS multidrug transporter-like protein [Amylocarpus encephaloides]